MPLLGVFTKQVLYVIKGDALKTVIDNELERLVIAGTLEKVTSSDWAAPILSQSQRKGAKFKYAVTIRSQLISL